MGRKYHLPEFVRRGIGSNVQWPDNQKELNPVAGGLRDFLTLAAQLQRRASVLPKNLPCLCLVADLLANPRNAQAGEEWFESTTNTNFSTFKPDVLRPALQCANLQITLSAQ